MNNQRFYFNVMHRQQVTGADSFGRHSRDSIACRAESVVPGCARLIRWSCVSARLRVLAAVACRANGVYDPSESVKDVVVHVCCVAPLGGDPLLDRYPFWANDFSKQELVRTYRRAFSTVKSPMRLPCQCDHQ